MDTREEVLHRKIAGQRLEIKRLKIRIEELQIVNPGGGEKGASPDGPQGRRWMVW